MCVYKGRKCGVLLPHLFDSFQILYYAAHLTEAYSFSAMSNPVVCLGSGSSPAATATATATITTITQPTIDQQQQQQQQLQPVPEAGGNHVQIQPKDPVIPNSEQTSKL